MEAARWGLVALLAAGCLLWGVLAVLSLLVVRRVVHLSSLPDRGPEPWPKVSVVVPACNEEDTLAAATESRLHDDYPNLEIILVEDRSTDATPLVADQLAARDPRVRVRHVTALPEGWLGKVHAMHVGVGEATGDWLLFTDADVHLSPGTLRRAIAWCERRGLDHLGVLPQFDAVEPVLDSVVSVMVRTVCLGARLWAVEDPRSRAPVGVGAFNLVRRAAFERTEGFPWLRMEVADDLGLGLLLKLSGARCSAALGRGCVRVRWYPSLRAMVGGVERAAFAATGRSRPWLCALVGLAWLWQEWSPWAALLLPLGLPWLHAAGALAAALAVGVGAGFGRWMGLPASRALLQPLGGALAALSIVRAAWVGWRRGGIRWRGTFYPSDLLRAGRRVRVP